MAEKLCQVPGSAMRKSILTLLLLVMSNGAAADWEQPFVPKSNLSEWVVANQNEAATIYADTATIRRAGNIAYMWDLTDFRTGRVLSAEKRSFSLKKEQEYDCAKQRGRILYISWHAGNMGGGEIIGSDRNAGDWRPVLLGTVFEKLWRSACGR